MLLLLLHHLPAPIRCHRYSAASISALCSSSRRTTLCGHSTPLSTASRRYPPCARAAAAHRFVSIRRRPVKPPADVRHMLQLLHHHPAPIRYHPVQRCIDFRLMLQQQPHYRFVPVQCLHLSLVFALKSASCSTSNRIT